MPPPDSPLEKLKGILRRTPPGPMEAKLREEVLAALKGCWCEFQGAYDEAMEEWKLGRAEDLVWDPPLLTFTIERHGGTVLGSTRAEIQWWTVNFNTREVNCEKGRSYRQLYPRESPWKAEPVAKEIAKLILEGKNDPRLHWVQGRRTEVQIRSSKVIPGQYRETRTGRTKRFYLALEEELAPHGWRRVPGTNKLQKTPASGKQLKD